MPKKPETETPQSDRDHANKSGIPLQRWLAHLIRYHDWDRNTYCYHWKVESEEVPVDGEFLDLLARGASHPGSSNQAITLRAAIEVKRAVDASGNPARFLFLTQPDKSRWNTLSRAWLPYLDPRVIHIGGSQSAQRLCAGEFSIGVDRAQPRIAEHCIFVDRKGSETLDNIAQGLMSAIDALSMADVKHAAPFAFLPMVVTNADLRVLQLENVDLETGALTAGNTEGDQVPWVAYTKTLAQQPRNPFIAKSAVDYAEWSDERVRTVFVVRAAKLLEFLGTLQVTPPDELRSR